MESIWYVVKTLRFPGLAESAGNSLGTQVESADPNHIPLRRNPALHAVLGPRGPRPW